MTSDELRRLREAARQLIQTDRALAGESLAPGSALPPLPQASVPQSQPARAAASARASDRSSIDDGRGSVRPPRTQARRQAHTPQRGGQAPRSTGPASDTSAFYAGPSRVEPLKPRPLSPEARGKADALAEVEQKEVQRCHRCGLCKGRRTVVFGEGNPDADLVFIGEGPGEEEDKQGRPFVGRAGALLTKMILAMGLEREDVYITNVVKCRPPGNRTPTVEEVEACREHLEGQLRIIQPKVIVALGNPATKALLNTSVGITRMRGRWQSLPTLDPKLSGIKVMPTFHPAFLLRQYTEDNRKKVWSDLQEVMRELGLPLK